MSKQIGHIKAMSVNITQPLKLEIPKMEFSQLIFLVGKNGSGKSIMMKLHWGFAMIANYFAAGKKLSLAIDYIKEFQFILDNSFDDNNLDGEIEAFFEEATIIGKFTDGKIDSVECKTHADIAPNKFPIYMSVETRLFDSFTKYMQMKKALGITNTFQMFSGEELKKMVKIYKLYDLLFIENMLIGLNGYMLDDETKKTLSEKFEVPTVIDQIIVDQDECELYALNLATLEKFKLTRLSKGEQSILNMLLAPKIV